MDNFNSFWNSFTKTADDDGDSTESPSAEAAENDHVNPRPEYWDMLADGSLVTKTLGKNPGGRTVVAAPGTCPQCDSGRTHGEFSGPAHTGPICNSSCYPHCTAGGHY